MNNDYRQFKFLKSLMNDYINDMNEKYVGKIVKSTEYVGSFRIEKLYISCDILHVRLSYEGGQFSIPYNKVIW